MFLSVQCFYHILPFFSLKARAPLTDTTEMMVCCGPYKGDIFTLFDFGMAPLANPDSDGFTTFSFFVSFLILHDIPPAPLLKI